MFIQPEWPAPSYVKAYTTLRTGGSSAPPFNDFNLGLHTGDDEQTVMANRKLLQQSLHIPQEPVWLNQTHSNIVVEAKPENYLQNADASFSNHANQVCVVMTADCLPILCCSTKEPFVSAIHAGWRGLASGIINKALDKIPFLENLLVWLGPAIGPQHFEVGEDVYEAFTSLNPKNQTAFRRSSPKKWLANIYELARIQLADLGISQIYGGTHCTFNQSDLFFSYRRDKGKTGRMASLIWLEES